MDCVNHPGTTATAYCQSCGKALCPGCVRTAAGGQVFCDPCSAAWQSFQQPFGTQYPVGAPNPAAAAVLGLIPGVGAFYNGQFFKGIIHVVIFAVLISITDHYPIFGLFIAAWILYQSFEAFHTAKARRDGQPLPDPLGLNELGSWMNLGRTSPNPGPQANYQAPGPFVSGSAAGQTPFTPGVYAPPAGDPAVAGPPPSPGYQQVYAGGQYQPYGTAYVPPATGYVDAAIPPVPPVPPVFWRRREPIFAIVLIALGALFLLNQFDLFSDRVFRYSWPLIPIGLGVWMIVRRLGESQGGPK